MPINFENLPIQSIEDFVDYFIYYYEYTFVLDEMSNIDVKKEIETIVKDSHIENDYKKLWIYTYLKFILLVTKDYPITYIKETILKVIKNLDNTDPKILEIQLELIKDILDNMSIITLQIRPYEQLKLQSIYGEYLKDKERNLIELFTKYLDNFSVTNVNKICYTKLKNNKFIDLPTILYEYYTVILFEVIEDKLEKEFNKNLVEEKVKEFLSTFKKGKLNQELFNILIKKTETLSTMYIAMNIK